MKFCQYIKHCRQKYNLTQEDLVEYLYNFDDIFQGLDAVTLSRWERCLTSPNIARQQKFIQAMQNFCSDIFPCWQTIPFTTIENTMYQKGIQKIIGKHKKFILDFPIDIIDENKISFTTINNVPNPYVYLELTRTFINKITKSYLQIKPEVFNKLALHPSSFFLLATYQHQFFGVIFSFRLKKDSFEKLISQQITENEIDINDLAQDKEIGYEYPFTFFAYTEQTATILALRYYIHLLQNQHIIKSLGSVPKSVDGKKLVETLGLKDISPDVKKYPKAFTANIIEVLTNPYILKMIFTK
jgi:transcriptional regulator with XRE-family HTH domain